MPCLPRVGEALVVELASQGAESVLLVDGNCGTCKYGGCAPSIDESVDRANALLASHESTVRVGRATGFPDDMHAENAGESYGSTRRGFFSDAAAAAKETAKVAAKTTLENELGYKLDELSIGERLRVTETGTLPQLQMVRHDAILNALDTIGLPESGAIDSRLFGSVSINAQKCNACGMCAVFCPTGALRRDKADDPSNPIKYFEFSAADCVQCALCVDVCWKGALALSPSVDASELYDFEPRTFDLSNAAKAQKGRLP